ncbi:MAG: prepilin-type N-terminal cleavage/methylation domain-containing protein [Planctomycetota bacterium]
MMILQTGKNCSKILSVTRRVRRTNNPGLTLLETLVAVSIFAICVVAIFQVFVSCFEARLRAENLGKTIGIASDAMESAEDFGIPLSDSGELEEDICHFTWEFSENDVDTEHYPKLKEIILDTTWEQGKHKGRFSLTTYYWKPNE